MRLIKGLTRDKRGHMMRGRVQSGSYIESVIIYNLNQISMTRTN